MQMQREDKCAWTDQLHKAQLDESNRRKDSWVDLVNELVRQEPSIERFISFRCDRDLGVLMTVDGLKVHLLAKGMYSRSEKAFVDDLEHTARGIRGYFNKNRWREIVSRVEREADTIGVKGAVSLICIQCECALLKFPPEVVIQETSVRMQWKDIATCTIDEDEGITVEWCNPTIIWSGVLSSVKPAAERLAKKVPLYSNHLTA